MNFRLENLGILFGLIALAIPVVLHILRRRRFDVVDWGAMQFLPDSITAHHRRWLDEILLMLIRMGMIALIVVALATPISTSAWLAPLRDQSTRDIVLIFDGSYSMNVRLPGRTTPWQEAVGWARTHLEQAARGDRFAIAIARQPPLVWLEDFSGDPDEVRAKLESMPAPHGNPDMPRALAEAWQHLLTRSRAAAREIIVLTDQQHFGWADPGTLAALEGLGNQWYADAEQAKTEGRAVPSLRVVPVGGELPPALPNYALAPITAARGMARSGQKISFQSALHMDGFSSFVRPGRIRVTIDGMALKPLPLPEKSELKQGQIPLRFQHAFDRLGQHLVSLKVETDAAHDVLTADNEQHAIVEVVKELPVLLVDGEKQLSPESSSFFLQRALATRQKETQGAVAIPYPTLTPASILPDTADAVKPAVVVLADVARLTAAQTEALDRFLAEGGGLLIVAGERVAREKAFYNEHLYRQGQGWLPAPLGEFASAQPGVQPEARTFQHPALEMLRTAPDGSMKDVRFTHWFKLRRSPKDSAVPIAMLSNGDPFLLEKPYKQGRVILSTVPLDRSANSTLPNVWEFPILVHELVSYLAGGRNAAVVLRHGEPIRLSSSDATLQPFRLRTPEIAEKMVDVASWPWVYHDTGAIGSYHVQASMGPSWSYVVPPDLRESNLARCTDGDWRTIRECLPIDWQMGSTETVSRSAPDATREELWWLLLLAVLGVLCVEVWMTRRMVMARGR